MKRVYKKLFVTFLTLIISFSFAGQVWADTNFIWAKSFDVTSSGSSKSLYLDTSGNVYTTGYFDGTADFDPGAGTSNLTSAGSADIFISKLDSSGNFVWVKQIGGSNNEIVKSIKLDSSDNIYTTGYFEGTVDFDPGAGTSNLTSAGSADIFISKLDSSGNFVWAKSMGGIGDDIGYGIKLDSSGNVYTAGSFEGTVDFDPGAGTSNLTSAGGADIFISKLDSSGNFVWAKSMGGTGGDIEQSIEVDSSGNVYTTGYFQGTTDFDPGAGTSNLTSAGGADIFISKLDSSGNFVWVKQIGGLDDEFGLSLYADSLGNIYTTGTFLGTPDFDPGVGTANLTSVGDEDIFISKLDSSGNFVWAKQMGGLGADRALEVFIDSSDNVYTTGYFEGTVDFDPGAGTSNLTSAGDTDIFISRLDSSGNFVWAKGISGIGGGSGNSLYLDSSDNIYTTGYFEGTTDFDPGAGTTNLTSTGNTPFILKLSQTSTPTTSTTSASSITTTTAVLTGNITDTGGEANTERGFDIGTDNTYAMSDVEDVTGSYSTGSYSLTATGLTCNTTYHYRSYSTNSVGTGTGSDDTFTTEACPSNTTSSTSASARVTNLLNMGKVQEAQEILNQFPNVVNEISNTNNNTLNKELNNKKATERKGSKSNSVKEIQTKLKIKADGIFGPITEKAVKDFQKQNNLKVDGVVGLQTWGVLEKVL